MYFNLTTTEVITSFSQAQESDFAVGSISGGPIILQEIDFQYNKLLNALPQEFLQLMEKVSGEVALVNISGSFNPGLYAEDGTLRGYIVAKNWSPCPNQSLEGYTMCWQQASQYYEVATANIQSNGNNSYTILDTFDYKTQNLILYYDVDDILVEIPSLKSVLRSMVCCSLGSRIYPVGQSDVWSIVTYYCEDASKWLDYYLNGGMPMEYKKIKLLNKKCGISSIRVTRS
jgi:hypothetical protein